MVGLSLLCAFTLISSAFTEEFHLKDYERMRQLRHLAVEFFDYHQNISSMDLISSFGPQLLNLQNLQCHIEIAQVSQGIQSGSIWALRVIDSWGNLPAGLLYGNLKDLGNYDECLSVDHPMPITGESLRGKYCFAKLFSGISLGSAGGYLSSVSIKTAVCFPASCSGELIEALLRQLIQRLLNKDISSDLDLINEKSCQTAEREPRDGLTIFTIVFLTILGGFMVLSTLYDYFVCEDQKKLPLLMKIFSARVNSRAVFRVVDSKSNPNVIECLHGIRCLSLMWVIFGHDYMISDRLPLINYMGVPPWGRSPFSMIVLYGVFSVDSFFFLSGLLLALIALRSMERTKGKINVPLMYLHRYLRLTPVLALALLVYNKILPLLGDGPIYKTFIHKITVPCQETWFWTLLYVQNYAVTKNMCLIHSWYLSVDMQLYLVSPILLIALYKWDKKAVAGIVVLFLLLASFLFSMVVLNGYSKPEDSVDVYYGTHLRASPWIIGLLFGYYLHVNRGRTFKLNRLSVWLGWIICLALICTCLFAVYPYPANGKHLPTLCEAFHMTLSRIAWPLALVWVVFACQYGYGGLANSFLSSTHWQPLSKLSYCIYMWHVLIAELHGGTTRISNYFSDYQEMLRFWADFGFSILLAYLMYILVEAPCAGVELLLSAKSLAKPNEGCPQSISPEIRLAKVAPDKSTSPLEAVN